MYRIISMIALMVATGIMGLAFTVYAIQRSGTPLDVIDAHEQTQTYLTTMRAEQDEHAASQRADRLASDKEPAR